jgi:hypothetical protein
MLSTKALLVSVSISQWGNRKKDKQASAAVENQFSAGKKSGGYNKKLLPGAKELERVSSLVSSFRTWVKSETLPWLSDGTRILASKNFIDFAREFQKREIAFKQAVAAYPDLQVEAQKTLGSLYRPEDYPDSESIKRAFSCEVSYLPLPQATDFRVEIGEDVKEKLVSQLKSVESEAVTYCFTQVSEVIREAVERLSSPDPSFNSTLLNGLTKLVSVLPKLNVTDNPDLEATRRELETIVSKIDPKTCKRDLSERQTAAAKLKEIQDRMGSFMGSPSKTA